MEATVNGNGIVPREVQNIVTLEEQAIRVYRKSLIGMRDAGARNRMLKLRPKKPERLRLIHPSGYDYYATLRAKLHWAKEL